jgi:hypothetical protein
MEFVLDKVAMGQLSSEFFFFLGQFLFLELLRIY